MRSFYNDSFINHSNYSNLYNKHTLSILECRTISQNMISKTLAAMNGSEPSLKAYPYTSFRDFGLTILTSSKCQNMTP